MAALLILDRPCRSLRRDGGRATLMRRSIARFLLVTACFVVLGSVSAYASCASPPLQVTGVVYTDDLLVELFYRAQNFRTATLAAGEEIKRCRERFYAQLDKGKRNTSEEQEFQEVLFEKDIYYLSLYISGGVDVDKPAADALHLLAGGNLDEGIRPLDYFTEWVDAMRDALGVQRGEVMMMFYPDKVAEAMVTTRKTYEGYRAARDKKELENWQQHRRVYAPLPKTSSEFINSYVDYSLNEQLEARLSVLNEGEKSALQTTIERWRPRYLQAISDYENVSFDSAGIEKLLRLSGTYTDQEIASFRQTAATAESMPSLRREEFFANALCDLIAERDARIIGRRSSIRADPSIVAGSTRLQLYSITTGKLTDAESEAYRRDPRLKNHKWPNKLYFYGMGPGKPVGLPLRLYEADRSLLLRGILWRQSPIPASIDSGELISAKAVLPETSSPVSPAHHQAIDPKAPVPGAPKPSAAPTSQKASSAAQKLSTVVAALPPVTSKLPVQASKPQRPLADAAPMSPEQARSDRPDGPFGPKILGAQLGMSLDQASAVIRREMNVQAVIDNNPKAWGFGTRALTARIFVSSNGSDLISLFWVRDGEPRVVALSRWKALPDPAPPWSQALAYLKTVWGSPLSDDNPVWSDQPAVLKISAVQCRSFGHIDLGNGFAFTEGQVPDPRPGAHVNAGLLAMHTFNLPMVLASGKKDDFARLKECPLVGWVSYNTTGSEPSFSQSIIDGAWLATKAATQGSAAGDFIAGTSSAQSNP